MSFAISFVRECAKRVGFGLMMSVAMTLFIDVFAIPATLCDHQPGGLTSLLWMQLSGLAFFPTGVMASRNRRIREFPYLSRVFG